MSSILRCLCRCYQSSNRMSARVAHSKEVKRTLATRKDWKRQATDTTTTIRLATCLLLSLLPPVSKLKDGTILNTVTAAGVLELGLQLHNFRYSAWKEDQPQQATKFRKLYGVDPKSCSRTNVVNRRIESFVISTRRLLTELRTIGSVGPLGRAPWASMVHGGRFAS
jgi:hypothetical protein